MSIWKRISKGLKVLPDVLLAVPAWPAARRGLDKISKFPPQEATEEERMAISIIRAALDRIWAVITGKSLRQIE